MVKHLKILGREASQTALDDPIHLRQLIYTLIDSVGMTILGQPHIYQVPLEVQKLNREPFEDEGGISCLACLSTSHVSLHAWPLRSEFHLDIYSCRSFDPAPVLDLIRNDLQTYDLQVTDLSKACEWTTEPISEVGHVLQQSGQHCPPTTRIRFDRL